jgi:hypothetical protein
MDSGGGVSGTTVGGPGWVNVLAVKAGGRVTWSSRLT